MNKKVKYGLGLFVLFFILFNLMGNGLCQDYEISQYFSNLEKGTEYDYGNILSTQPDSSNNYRSYFYLKDMVVPYSSDFYTGSGYDIQNIYNFSGSETTNYVFLQSYFEFDDKSFLADTNNWTGSYSFDNETDLEYFDEFFADCEFNIEPSIISADISGVWWEHETVLNATINSATGVIYYWNGSMIPSNNEFEISYWFYIDHHTEDLLMEVIGTMYEPISVLNFTSEKIYFGYTDDLENIDWIEIYDDFNHNKWHYIKIEGICDSNDLQIYIDNILIYDDIFSGIFIPEGVGTFLWSVVDIINPYTLYLDGINVNWDILHPNKPNYNPLRDNSGNFYLQLKLDLYDYSGSSIIYSPEFTIYALDKESLDEYFNISVDILEIQWHFYVGLNDELVNSTNLLLLMYANNNYTLTYNYNMSIPLSVYETGGYYLGYKLGINSFRYFTTDESSCLNFFHNSFRGMRVLKSQDRIYNSFVDFPIFPEYIVLAKPDLDNPSQEYWLYQSCEIAFAYYETIEAENLSMNFPMIQVILIDAKFYVNHIKGIGGNWGVNDWVRQLLNSAIRHLISYPLQFMLYFLTITFNYIIMYIIVGSILILFWNIVIYYLMVAILWLIWLLYEFIYEVLPIIIEWLLYTAIPFILDIVIEILAIVIGTILWLFTLGLADLEMIIDIIQMFLTEIFYFIYDILLYFIEHLFYVLLYIIGYILIIYLLYVKFIYVKSKGYTNRQEQIKHSYGTYAIPITFIKKLTKTTYDIIPVI